MSEYNVKLVTSDAQTISLTCNEGEDIIAAAEKANIHLAAQCQTGSCGACKAQCDAGEYSLAEYSVEALSDADAANRQVLMCCTYPHSDLKMTLPYEYSLVRFEKTPVREATITSISYLNADTVKLKLQLLPDEEDNLSLDFEPGQFVQIGIPDSDIKRSYSLTNAPNWDGLLEFLIKLRPGGQIATFLRENATPGMKLTLEGPHGWFMLKDNGLRPRYFVAGGCGVASIMSMLRRMSDWQEPHQARLFFGVWREEEVFYQQELADLAAEYPNFQYQICVFEASESWQGYRGSVVAALEEALKATDSKPDIYICGSPGLVENVVEAVKPFGINEEDLIYERFLASTQSTKAGSEQSNCRLGADVDEVAVSVWDQTDSKISKDGAEVRGE